MARRPYFWQRLSTVAFNSRLVYKLVSSPRDLHVQNMSQTSDSAGLPNLIVIGGSKTGTTSLHYYLNRHPQIFMSREKEVRFFSDHFKKNVGWYRSHFEQAGDVLVRGETSPQYTAFPQVSGVPQRMHALLPEAKLIYIVRDPLARMMSHFAFVTPVSDSQEFARALAPLETNPFVAASRQCWQLEQYLRHYALDRILILTSEELRLDRRGTLARAFRFLGIDDTFYSSDCDVELNVSARECREHTPASKFIGRVVDLHPVRWIPLRFGVPMRDAALRMFSRSVSQPMVGADLKDRLQELFLEDTNRLRRLTGLRFEHWSV